MTSWLDRDLHVLIRHSRQNGAQEQVVVVPAGLDQRSESILGSSPRRRLGVAVEVIEELVHGTAEVVQYLIHIAIERSVEHTKHLRKFFRLVAGTEDRFP